MALTSYVYSVSTDFSAGVAPLRLQQEVGASAIATSISYIQVDADDCALWFSDALTSGDQTTLDGLVAAHSGLELRDPIRIIGSSAFEPVVPGASRVVANDQPAIEIAAGSTGFASAQVVWPYPQSAAAELTVRMSFILKTSLAGSNVRLAARLKCQPSGTDTSLAFTNETFIVVPVNYTTLGETFEATLTLATPDCTENSVVLLQIGRDGNNELGAGTNDDVTSAIQIIFIDGKVS